MAVLILASAAVGVSAAYVDMFDFGLAYGMYLVNGSISYANGAGSTVKTKFLMPYWALDSFNPDYTYTFTFSFISQSSLEVNVYTRNVYLSNKKEYSSLTHPSKVFASVTKEQQGSDYKYTFTVKLNPGLLQLDYFPLYVYCNEWISDNAVSVTTNGWSVSCEYDPGGSNYLEFLADIRDQLHAGDDYTPPDSAASSLDNSVGGLTSAEGVLKDKSSSLKDSVSSELSSNISSAKALVTTLKPASVQINNLYTTVMTALPAEVKAVFIAIPLLLFIGWLIGRIRE